MATTEIVLTQRQREVARGLAHGWNAEEVGRDLGISARTVKAHCDNMRRILGVPKARLIPAAIRAKMNIDPLDPRFIQ